MQKEYGPKIYARKRKEKCNKVDEDDVDGEMAVQQGAKGCFDLAVTSRTYHYLF